MRFPKERGRERILTFDEEHRYLKVTRNLLTDVATLMLEMGLRPKEVCSIRQENLHLGTRPPFLHVPGGKTKNARRGVVLTERARETLKRRLIETKGDHIFPVRVGRGFDWSHPMRHTYGTRAIEIGTDPLTLTRLMGHQDLKTTMRYVHLSKAHLREAQMRIERYRARREREEKQEKQERKRGSRAVG